MSDLRELYQQVILDHNKNPRNYKELPAATAKVEGYNPLCGDHYTVYLQTEGDTIRDVAFTGSGCAISKASASVMSSTVKGKTKEEADRLFDTFQKLVTGHGGELDTAELGRLAAFSGVSEFPARVKCATLAWHTLRTALQGGGDKVSTE
ncbi:MAG TPA: SUF system NifU family Fe-S cluster assembly protein [Thermoanaerobaculia bacterium]|jgi:nitrogen fixation NifU-like protein|nr:SUF system NifU family Fe-S cluster assembly protein [Thermoanaerobaculia bacterium]